MTRRGVIIILLNRVKYHRNKQGLSVEQLAKLSGLSKSTISDIENFNQIPSQISMLCVSHALGLKVGMVFNLDTNILKEYKRSL